MKKRSLLLTFTLILALACFSLAFSVFATVSATTVVTKFKMNGAYVRDVENTTGLRFECVVDCDTYDAVMNDNNKVFGAFIVPQDYLDDNSITTITTENNHVTQFAAKSVNYKFYDGIRGTKVDEESETSDYLLRFSIVTIQYGNYTRDFTSLFYIKTNGETPSYEYATVESENNVRSVGYVAQTLIESNKITDTVISFAVKAKYIELNGFDPNNSNESLANAAVESVTVERLTDINDNIDNLPATDADVSMANQTAIVKTYNAYSVLSATGKALYPSAYGTAISSRYTEFNNNYTVLFDITTAFGNNSVSYASMQDGWLRWNTSYTNYNNIKNYDSGNDEYLGNYREFNAQLGSQNLIFSYKDSELATKIGSNDYVYMYVYNSDSSTKNFTADFGTKTVGSTYVTLPANSWSLIEIPAADFINGTSFGILYYGGNHTPKFGSIFTCSIPYAARMEQYNDSVASGVVTAINALNTAPAYADVTKDTTIPASLSTVNTNYNALSNVAKYLVTNKNNLDAWNVTNSIKLIDTMEGSVAHNKSALTSAQAAYDALDTDLQADVVNSAKLTTWANKASKVTLLYESRSAMRSNITNYADTPVVQNAEQVEVTPPQGYGELHALRGVGSDNYYIQLNSIPDLTGYDVVRFPIWVYSNPDNPDAYYYLCHRFNGQDFSATYARLYQGLNIVTVPVSYLYAGFRIGVNNAPAGEFVYFAIPYAEKLGEGDVALCGYNAECNHVFVSGTGGSYVAIVSGGSAEDATYGTVAKFRAEKNSENSGAGSNWAARYTDIGELQSVVAATGATKVKFKVYKNGSGGSAWLYIRSDSANIEEFKAVQDTWTEFELTAAEVASWNGIIRKDWGTTAEFWFTDFTLSFE